MQQSETRGKFIGVGVGPGDPELLTMKATRLIIEADVISYLCSDSGLSQAKSIARYALAQRSSNVSSRVTEIPVQVPMSTDRGAANSAYDQGAKEIATLLDEGKVVVFLCEGDPLFFGSFSYLLERLQSKYVCEVVPGISSVNAAASTLVSPLTLLKESFVVVSGRHSDVQIETALNDHDTVVIMKAGQARVRILDLLTKTGRQCDAKYLEYIGRENECVVTDVSLLPREAGPYFSLFVVLASERITR